MTLLLLHGSGATPALWDRVVANLPGLPVVVPALPGRSRVAWSDREPGRDVAAYARALIALMDRDGIDRATIAGHSLGGAIALHVALEHPDRVAGLGLMCTGTRLRMRPEVLDGLADGVRDTIDVLANAQCGPRSADVERIILRRMVEQVGMEQTLIDLNACDRFDVTDRVDGIRIRTQIFAGAADVVTPEKYGRYLAEQIPAARITVFDHGGHALPLEFPEDIAGDLAVLWAATTPIVAGPPGRRSSAGPAAGSL